MVVHLRAMRAEHEPLADWLEVAVAWGGVSAYEGGDRGSSLPAFLPVKMFPMHLVCLRGMV
jgi:hypothetical protein